MVHVKRIYDEASPEDGVRVLVDRVWPRGVSKSRASIDRWMKEVAPSRELRRWFNHDSARWPEFKRRYWSELEQGDVELLAELTHLAGTHTVTLLYSARDREHNQAQALCEFLLARGKGS